jgi:hypothetical protein
MRTIILTLFTALVCQSAFPQQRESSEESFAKRYGLSNSKKPAAAKPASTSEPIPQPTYFKSNGITYQVAAPCYRIVTNHVFNIEKSPLWKTFDVECLETCPSGIIVKTVNYKCARRLKSAAGGARIVQHLGGS